jgi:hypothetical protein
VSRKEKSSPTPYQRESRNRAALVAAYRAGLGLAAVAVMDGAAGIRMVAIAQVGNDLPTTTDKAAARWWCRRAADAERVVAAATLRLRRRESLAGAAADLANKEIAAAAKRLSITLYSDDEISAAATAIIARVDQQLETLQRSGGLKLVNRSYRAYRIESSARGEKVLPYAEWINKYKESLVRQLAAALR